MKEFAPFRLDTINQCLWRHGEAVDDECILITPKAFAVLRYLVEHAGRPVARNELLEAVWPGTFVQPEVLNALRKCLRATLTGSGNLAWFDPGRHRARQGPA